MHNRLEKAKKEESHDADWSELNVDSRPFTESQGLARHSSHKLTDVHVTGWNQATIYIIVHTVYIIVLQYCIL